MKSLRFWLTTTAVVLVALPGPGRACSPASTSLYEQFSKHSTVFLGTVKERIRGAGTGPRCLHHCRRRTFKDSRIRAHGAARSRSR